MLIQMPTTFLRRFFATAPWPKPSVVTLAARLCKETSAPIAKAKESLRALSNAARVESLVIRGVVWYLVVDERGGPTFKGVNAVMLKFNIEESANVPDFRTSVCTI
ncbi:hypothetical protein BDR26DRAFT_943951 [Obelidium mucronatum]|nr:hypothetical protein BDR26DRAFT_943951 [Obelidium mucronatum]